MKKYNLDEKLFVVAYFFTRCCVYDGGFDVSPPKILGVATWSEAYKIFFSLSDSNIFYSAYVSEMDSLRVEFGKIIEKSENRVKGKNSNSLQEIFWIWKDRSDEDLLNFVLDLKKLAERRHSLTSFDLAGNESIESIESLGLMNDKILISSNSRGLLRNFLLNHPRWEQCKSFIGKSISNFLKEDYVEACKFLAVDIKAIIEHSNQNPTDTMSVYPPSKKFSSSSASGIFSPVASITPNMDELDWIPPNDLYSQTAEDISDLKFDDYGINTEDVHITDIIKTGLVEDFSESNFFPKDETFFFNNEGTEQKSEIEQINSFTNFKKNLVLDNTSQKNEENQIIDKSRKSSDIDLEDENYIRLFIGNIVADQETVSKMLNDIILSLEEDISLLSSEGADCFDALNYRKALYIAKYGDRLQRFRSKLLDLKADWDDQDFIFDIDSEIFD